MTQAPQPAISATQTMIDEQLDHLYDGYCDDLEKEFATQTDADRLGFIAEPGPFAMYQED